MFKFLETQCSYIAVKIHLAKLRKRKQLWNSTFKELGWSTPPITTHFGKSPHMFIALF